MGLGRREFLTGAAALTSGTLRGVPASAGSGRYSDPKRLHARLGSAQLAPPDLPETPVWSYEGRVPGPTLRVKQGRRVVRKFINELPQPSTIHWHGIRLDNAMDGVPDLTQPAVPPGGTFLYDFAAPDAGTFWYHPHNRGWEQLARGLYGALVVEEPDPPEVDRDEVLLIDDWRLAENATIDESFGNLHDWAHNGRIGNWITVNGDSQWTMSVPKNDRLRLRLVNVANSRIFSLSLMNLKGWAVAIDGQPVASPFAVERLELAPAQRVDLIVDAVGGGSEAFILSREQDVEFALATFTIAGKRRRIQLPQPTPLHANPVSQLGLLDNARRVALRMEGGAMGTMRSAMLDNTEMGPQELVQHGKVWSMNGIAEMPKEPLVRIPVGDTVRISMINETAWPHGMHLHGHHFREIAKDGSLGPLRDTLLVEHTETTEIAFVADNPGDWLLHCHMLEHSVSGMKTWLRVET